jgi:prepilin-type processing-associated H-X9-DG protein
MGGSSNHTGRSNLAYGDGEGDAGDIIRSCLFLGEEYTRDPDTNKYHKKRRPKGNEKPLRLTGLDRGCCRGGGGEII